MSVKIAYKIMQQTCDFLVNNWNLVMYVDKTSKTVIEFRIYKHVDIYKA